MSPTADAARVAAARAGDRHALESLLGDHLPLVYAVVRRALGADPDVDDVVQETMLRAVRHLRGLRDADGFKAWLVSIAVSQIQERARRLARQRARAAQPIDLAVDAAEPPDPETDVAALAEDRVDLDRELRLIAHAAGFLNPAERQTLALWSQEVAGTMTRAEVAAALSLSPAHTAVRVQRMRARLDLALTVLRALRSTPRCPGLGEVAATWDRTAEPRWLKRLGRHVADCEVCLLAGRRGVPAVRVLALPWLLPVPAVLAGRLPEIVASTSGGGLGAVAPAVDAVRRVIGYLNVKVVGTAGVGVAAATAAVLAVSGTTPPAVAPPTPGPPPQAAPATSAAPVRSATPSPSAPPAPARHVVTAEGVTSADIYVATDGDDTGPGTAARPYATLAKAVQVVQPGQVVALRAGTHRPTATVEITIVGTASRRITVSNLVGERPVVDGSALPGGQWLITQRGGYWTVQGLEMRNAPSHAYVCRACRGNVFRRLWLHDNGDTALTLRDAGTQGNHVLDSDFARNHDTVDRGGSADGLAIKNGAGAGNVVRGCRFAENSGDGLDLSNFTDPVTVVGNWAYGNGHNRWDIAAFNGPGNGIKLGGGAPAPAVAHVVVDNASWDNAGYGFTEASNPGRLTATNNTAYRNGGTGFAFVYSSARLRNNLALANGRDVQVGGGVDDADNSWGQDGWATTVLRSGDPATARGERAPSGQLPPTTFLLNRKDKTMGASMTAGGDVPPPA
ncbi:sigma-70 family RNA polymerase sigma factor [Catellatospora sichuanensis]|uniref:sigma-70 family RNA polymerase sigma factor n=1 Tax=Catellatospora sichuanensis TaxID=1969805 RepID=UPI0011823D3B|nr:sigma-70 family RNA polymerase sigma factor [Catellatospora sichuanensis]